MANFAFPELHPKTKLRNEPENLLVLTTTRTDERGRRHSVAVPLIPPPDGERFEGGYHIERNPITGGARLVPPTASERVKGSTSGGEGGSSSSLHPKQSTVGGSTPIFRRGRRHSIQVSTLSKDMDR